MTHTAEISRKHPGCIVCLIDQSKSMSDPYGGRQERSKAERLADAVNLLLHNILDRNSGGSEGKVLDRLQLGVIGYGAHVGSAWTDKFPKKDLVWLSEIEDKADIEERHQKVGNEISGLRDDTVKFMTWFKPVAENGTPMCKALLHARSILQPWISDHPDSFPPIVFNITDGEATDGDPQQIAADLRNLSTQDGNVLLFNVHVSSMPGVITYPESDIGLPDNFARQLFQMSSVLPPSLRVEFERENYKVGPEARGFVFNADIVEVIQCLDIGTRALR